MKKLTNFTYLLICSILLFQCSKGDDEGGYQAPSTPEPIPITITVSDFIDYNC